MQKKKLVLIGILFIFSSISMSCFVAAEFVPPGGGSGGIKFATGYTYDGLSVSGSLSYTQSTIADGDTLTLVCNVVFIGWYPDPWSGDIVAWYKNCGSLRFEFSNVIRSKISLYLENFGEKYNTFLQVHYTSGSPDSWCPIDSGRTTKTLDSGRYVDYVKIIYEQITTEASYVPLGVDSLYISY